MNFYVHLPKAGHMIYGKNRGSDVKTLQCEFCKSMEGDGVTTSHIERFLILIILVSSALISNSGLCTAESTMRYGFWSVYTNPSNYQPDWNALTHVAYSSWEINSNGTLIAPTNITHYNTIRDLSHRHGIKFIISISSSDNYTIDNILANHKDDFANNVLNAIQVYGADGVNLDFEFPFPTNSVTQTSNIVLFEEFMKTLNTTLKSSNPEYHICIDTSSVVEDTYRNRNLNKYMDSIFLMGYGYNWGEERTGPNSPYNDLTRNDVKDSVSVLLQYYDPQKIILGVPFYGHIWQADSGQPGANITNYDDSISDISVLDMKTAIDNSKKYGRLFDSNSNTPWCRYQSGTTWHQIWYDDEESIGLKYDYAKSENLGGIGFWALGYEQGHPEIWREFRLEQP